MGLFVLVRDKVSQANKLAIIGWGYGTGYKMNWQLVFLGSAVAACATSLGALPALGLRHLSTRSNNVLMGFSAGVMLSASSFSLIVPSLYLAADQTKTKFYGALQDVPEGFVVAAALMSVGYTKWQSIFVAVITGIVEAIAALFGFIATSFFQPLLPWMLAFAGGAMIYVVVEEMIPEIQGKRISSDASGGLLVGFVLMMVLDVALSV